ncbi:MAG: PEP-CTERM sorting domain-containing protein [Planctomycetota bacterium]
MKKFSLILGITASLLMTSAHAGSIEVTPSPTEPGTTGGGNDIYTFVLDPTGMEGTFDTWELRIVADDPINQTGNDAIQTPAEDSGFSAFLEAPPNFMGQGLSAFGVDPSTDTTDGISGTFASLGSNAASEQGAYTAAYVVVAPGGKGTFSYAFFDDGDEVASGSGFYGIPEPTSLMLAALGLISLAGRRRS